jgi:hypothetical protein
MPRLAWLVGTLGVALLLVGCDDPKAAVGLLVRGDDLIVLYDPCKDGRLVESVELEASDDAVLWRIESETGSTLRQFVVGEEPPGFSTQVALDMDLHGRRLRVEVSDVGPQYFDLSEIEPDMVLVVGEGNMTPEEFWARDTCDTGALFD